jgi:plasmid maintenance system antidote protein VapI
MTIQRRIFNESEENNNREFSKKIRRSESYTSNMLNSKKSITIELAIDTMERLRFEKDKIMSIVLLHLKEEFNIFA